MVEMEHLIQHYLFKLRQSAGVKRLIERQWSREDWCDAGKHINQESARCLLIAS